MAKASVTNIAPSRKKRDAKIAKAKAAAKREAAYVAKLWLSIPEPQCWETYRAIMADARAQRIARGEETAPVLRLVKGQRAALTAPT